MRAGAASVDITPPMPAWLCGFGVDNRVATEVADDLHARALVVEHEGRAVALVACELLWLERRNVQVLRRLIEESCGLAPGDVMVACTHTHSGPDTIDWWKTHPPVNQEWLNTLLRQIAGAVYLAQQRLRPARLETHSGHATLGVNRRKRAERGPVQMTANPEGPVEQALTTLRVVGDDGGLLASVVHHATHPVVLAGASLVVSGDWPGELCRTVEQALGGVCLYVNGACGDINPRAGVGRSYAEMLQVGRQAAGLAISLLCGEPAEPREALGAASVDISVPWQEHSYLTVPQQRRLAADGGLVTEVQALRLGPLSFISAPGECLVETGWKVLAETALRPAVIAGYTNDYVGYLPLQHIYAEGGYEPQATMLTQEAVLQYVAAAVEVADRLAAD